MQKYLNYLLADIAAAAEEVPNLLNLHAMSSAEDWAMAWMPADEEEKNAPRKVLEDHIKVKQEWFPPACRLTEKQMKKILNGMENCLNAFGFIVHFPSDLPIKNRYEVMVWYLKEEVPIMSVHSFQIDFCEYLPNSCPFGTRYCQCAHYKDVFENEDNSLGDFDFDSEDELNWEDEFEDWYDFDKNGIDRSGYDLPVFDEKYDAPDWKSSKRDEDDWLFEEDDDMWFDEEDDDSLPF